LLRLANSAFWGRGGRIDTASRAVRLLGMTHVHDLVLATSVAMAFKGLDPLVIDTGKFWRASVFRALAAAALATRVKSIHVERLFLEGLLSDIGHLVLYQAVPSLVGEAHKRAGSQPWTLADIETALIGCDYTEVGAVLAEEWMLPECFSKTIACQNKPWESATHAAEAGIVHVACWLSHRLGVDAAELEQPPLTEAALGLVALPETVLEEAAAEAEANVSAMAQLFTPATAAA
jgi:HD-like signal output (HDOD) protein